MKQGTLYKEKKVISLLIIILVVVFLTNALVMVAMDNSINSLNNEIVILEREYHDIVGNNEYLESEIFKGENLVEIEKYATINLGMIKPEEANKSYAKYNVGNDNIVAENNNSNISGWVTDVFTN